MLGDIENGTRRNNVNCGMTPRVFEHLFLRIQKASFDYLLILVRYSGVLFSAKIF